MVIDTAVSILRTPRDRQNRPYLLETDSFPDVMVEDPPKEAAAHGTFDAGACVVDTSGRKTKKSSAQTVFDGATGGKKHRTLLSCIIPEFYRVARTCAVHVQPCAQLCMLIGNISGKPCVVSHFAACSIAPSLKMAHRIAKRPPKIRVPNTPPRWCPLPLACRPCRRCHRIAGQHQRRFYLFASIFCIFCIFHIIITFVVS